jgi:SAM-dependent methyltransferase
MTIQDQSKAQLRADRDVWEKAEIERSAYEAHEAEMAGIRMDERQLNRYLDPASHSPYSLEFAFSLLGDVRGQRVLDFGCGSGANSLVLRTRGADVTALDISPHLLQVTEKRLLAHGFSSGVEFVLASGHEMPLPDHSIDIVFGAAILHHLDLSKAASEIERILRPGGRAVFIEPVRDPKFYVAIRKAFPNKSEDISPFEYPLTTEQLDVFRSRFTCSTRRRFILPWTSVLQIARAPEPLIRVLRIADRSLMKAAPWLQHFATIEVFQVTKRV